MLPVTENVDGSLAVTLPPPPPPPPRRAAGAVAGAASELRKGTDDVEGYVVVARDSTQKKTHHLSWVADCGLSGYEH